jgi:hypothetical protein
MSLVFIQTVTKTRSLEAPEIMSRIRGSIVLMVILFPVSVRAQDPVTIAQAVAAVYGFVTDMEKDRETATFRSNIKAQLGHISDQLDQRFLNITDSAFAVARSEFAINLQDSRATDATLKLQDAAASANNALQQYRGRGIDASESYQAAVTLYVAILKERFRRKRNKAAAKAAMIAEFSGPNGIENHLKNLFHRSDCACATPGNSLCGGAYSLPIFPPKN